MPIPRPRLQQTIRTTESVLSLPIRHAEPDFRAGRASIPPHACRPVSPARKNDRLIVQWGECEPGAPTDQRMSAGLTRPIHGEENGDFEVRGKTLGCRHGRVELHEPRGGLLSFLRFHLRASTYPHMDFAVPRQEAADDVDQRIGADIWLATTHNF